jgi:LAO/AO transport system ATPase
LARCITQVASGHNLETVRSLGPPVKPARVVAITGSGGVGKSTLIGKLIEQLRHQGRTVAVLACDPESPLTGGALLGDRFRMGSTVDDGVYIRSLAASPGRQAIADHLDAIIRICEEFGFDVVIVETVGAGQGDTAVRSWADLVVLLLQPETGDELQWEKAGVLEVADLIVIHKADLPGAERAAQQVRSALELSGGTTVPVLLVSSRTGKGIVELADRLESLPLRSRHGDAVHAFLDEARRFLDNRLRQPGVAEALDLWRAGHIDIQEALQKLLADPANNRHRNGVASS